MGWEPARHWRTTTAVLAALTLGACASGRGGEDPTETAATPVQTPVAVRTMGEASGTRLVTNPSAPEAAGTQLDAAVPAAWQGLIRAYDELKITPDRVSTNELLLSVQNMRVRRALGGKPASWFLDCGVGPQGPVANTYDLSLNIRSQIRPRGENQSQILTLVTGTARPAAVSGSEVNCSTTGELEKRIATIVTVHAKGQGK
jgi:hypothetical protein